MVAHSRENVVEGIISETSQRCNTEITGDIGDKAVDKILRLTEATNLREVGTIEITATFELAQHQVNMI